MKTKFFKKLSLVLVVAMVLSLFVPAAGAFAAAKPKLNSTNKYLHLSGKPGPNEYNFNIRNKQKGWKYYWESDDEAIVEVNEKNGVATAVAVGKTKISVVITDKDGEEVETLTAKVTVRDNIKEVTISNPVEKLAVGAEHDYNRSFVTESGSTKKTDSITRWTVEPADKATINDKGVFVATEAGEFTVTARSFQSKAKHKDWTGDPEKYADYVLDSDVTKVTVSASMTSVDQLSLNKVNATFDSAMADVKENIRLYHVVGTTKVLQSLKDVAMDADNKVATLESYVNFIEGETYVIEYEGLEGLSFVAAKVEAAAVAKMEILTKTVMSGKSTLIDVALYNADGVNIADNVLKSRVTISSSNEQTWAEGRSLMMYNVGDTTTITATYNTYNYDQSGNQIGAVTATGVVTCVQYADTNITGINAWTITTGNSPDFVKPNHKIAALEGTGASDGSTPFNLFVKFDAKDDNGNYMAVESKLDGSTGITFESSNNNILIISEHGVLSPLAAGNVTVVVRQNDTVVGTIPVTVSPRRVLGSVSLDTYGFALSNSPTVADTKRVNITVKDQLGDNFHPDFFNVNVYPTNSNSGGINIVDQFDGGDNIWAQPHYTFGGAGATAGTYAYAVQITDNRTWASMTVHVTIQVREPKVQANYSYRIETDKQTYDTALVSWDNTEDVIISVFGYDVNGVRAERVQVASGGAKMIEVKRSGSDVPFDIVGTDGVVRLVDSAAKAGAAAGTDDAKISKMQNGTYSVRFLVDGVQKHSAIFTVKDTQMKPSVSVNKTYSATGKDAIEDGVKACFTISFDGYDVTDEIYGVESTGSNGTYFIKSVKYRQVVNGNAFVEHTVAINRTITLTDPN